jgi:hypothetical protein
LFPDDEALGFAENPDYAMCGIANECDHIRSGDLKNAASATADSPFTPASPLMDALLSDAAPATHG